LFALGAGRQSPSAKAFLFFFYTDYFYLFVGMQMPFADDVRKYTFASLDNLVNKKGEVVTKHPYIPTDEQQEAMDKWVDAMDLMHAGEKDEEGYVRSLLWLYHPEFKTRTRTNRHSSLHRNRFPWYDIRFSYNPAIHRTKQALFHSAVVQDLASNPLPPPHPELLKYFEPSKKVLKRAREALEECKTTFKVKQGGLYSYFTSQFTVLNIMVFQSRRR
jgi:ATP-dependent DNA helicase 2 subunit 2